MPCASAAAPEPPPPCTLVIFGAAGDLTHRLLMPTLHNLKRSGLLPDRFAVIGVARADRDADSFRKDLGEALREFSGGPVDQAAWDWLSRRIDYLRGDFDTAETYRRLGDKLDEVATAQGTGGNVLFYLATPPGAFAPIVRNLGTAGLVRQTPETWRRVVIEKPFGRDLASAQALNREILSVLDEGQVYRIDHYLGKETVQNILVFRFGNGMFEPMWNRHHIDCVQITVAEAVGVEHRGRFYDSTGALRDMVPNHLFQLFTLVAQEPPTTFSADALRVEKVKVLDAAHLDGDAASAVRGQYGAGTVRGKPVEAYRASPDVSPESRTETYAALRLSVDTWRWAGVPFYLRTGKALNKRRTEVAIRFREAPISLFRDTQIERPMPNDLILHIQPEEGVTLSFGAKVPGPRVCMGEVAMHFDYAEHFKEQPSTGYETLIYDCMIGDQTLFQSADMVEAGWRLIEPVLEAWAADPGPPPPYPAGSAGPAEADALLRSDGRSWRRIV